jgi:16S rRNA (guanine966-N2)-methyltransferase|tara:strand:- start:19969 stop:20553 length:585 start_codon:yes stop_codon:yes gene_type:complete
MVRKSKNNNLRPLGSVRIIGGQWRGRKLPVHTSDGLRPTGDRIRETLFNWLSAELYDARCLDLFAGSGALGFEALSNGASHVTMLELEPTVANQLATNKQLLNSDNANIENTDSLKWLCQYQGDAFKIVFVDPPFASQLWDQTLTALVNSTAVSAASYIYIEHPKNHAINLPTGWQWHRQKIAGDTAFGLAIID